jgi:heptosyltransferase-2
MVMAQSLFKLLKSREPDRALDVLAPEWSLPIVIAAGMRGHYDRAIVMPRSFKSALIPWLANIPVRTGFRGESRFILVNDVRSFDAAVLDQTVKRFAALGLEPGDALPDGVPEPSLQVSEENRDRVLDELGVSTAKPVIAMMPGAEYGPAKCWPLDYFAALAIRLADAGYSVWVLGSGKDADAGDVIARSNAAINLCGRTALEDVIDLLSACEQAVSNDSGLMHIAAAVGIHVHGIYGSSSSKFTPPLTKRRDIHEIDLDCRPCFERECPLGHLRCLRDLSPDQIFEKIVDKSR